jgi:hypothetical protein
LIETQATEYVIVGMVPPHAPHRSHPHGLQQHLQQQIRPQQSPRHPTNKNIIMTTPSITHEQIHDT